MRVTAFFFSLSSSAALVVACGTSGSSSGSPAGTLDCNWLTGPNCYKSTLSPALGCLPDPNAKGTMSADGKTCTYAGGQVIAFDNPVKLPLASKALLTFTVTSGGTQCLKVNQATNGFTVTTSAGSFVWTSDGGAVSATCPDGSSYAASEASALKALACASKVMNSPSAGAGSTSTEMVFGLDGTGPSHLPIFDCTTM
jgi:hypothetical protein